jgi:nicotinate dehydrogenase subunit A
MSRISLDVDGRPRPVDVEPDSPLLYVLRDSLGFDNPRFGCGLGQCGACTVLIDDKPVRSCVTPVSGVVGKRIVTLAGLGTPTKPHLVQTAFIEEQAFQCGYCLNGWVLTAKALLDTNPSPTDQQIRQGLDGLICRCGSHTAIFAAVRRAADARKNGGRA